MTGIYITKFTNGVTRLINLRNVAAISLQKTAITVEYNFANVKGIRNSDGEIESKPQQETLVWPTDEIAQREFSKIQKGMEELQ